MKIRPKNWESFQHYKTRRPPWIKLHRHILDDYEFHCLPVASKALAPLLWLIASESEDGSIDADSTKLGFRLRQRPNDITEAVKPLIESGFFEVVEDASNALAEREQNPLSEKSREETESASARVAINGHETPSPTDSVTRVFEHWRTTHEHPKAQLDLKRRKLIREALKVYPESDLIASITGFKKSAHHMGKNERKTKFDDIELFLRDAKHIDMGLAFGRGEGSDQWI